MRNTEVGFDTPISSVDLIAHFGVEATYKNAARAAQRLVAKYNLSLRHKGNGLWVLASAHNGRGGM
jgi:hypothetical protein